MTQEQKEWLKFTVPNHLIGSTVSLVGIIAAAVAIIANATHEYDTIKDELKEHRDLHKEIITRIDAQRADINRNADIIVRQEERLDKIEKFLDGKVP